MTRACLVALVVLAGCGQDRQERAAQPSIPPRVRLLTDAQFANAVRDLVGVEAPAIESPGTAPHQLVREEVLAIDGARLVAYRMAAEQVAQQLASAAPCGELACSLELAERAFRRPLVDDEPAHIAALFAQGGFALVVEAVLQAPSFLYRTELGPEPKMVAGRWNIFTSTPGVDDTRQPELTTHELAAELAFLLYDSLPDTELRAVAADGSLSDPDVLAFHVDRLLDAPRVQDHLVDVVLAWLQIHHVLDVAKNADVFPELSDVLRASMFGESERFVRDVLFQRDGSLRELLTSRATFVDKRLAQHYGMTTFAGETFLPITHEGVQRAGILTHASVLTAQATQVRQSIILRGKYVHDVLLCTPELGRPPFDAIAQVAAFASRLTESQYAHYRAAHNYCSSCHRIIDPPGRMLEHYDGIGRWQRTDEIGFPVEADATLEIDGVRRDLDGAIELGEALASSRQVARCAVERLAQHAFGRNLDAKNLELLVADFEANDRNLVEVFRAIATSPAFRQRRRETP